MTKLATDLTLDLGAGTVLGDPSGISATLEAAGSGLSGRTIFFVLDGTGATAGQGFVKSVTTDAAGVGVLGSTPNLPYGTTPITAYFNGAIPLNPWAPLAEPGEHHPDRCGLRGGRIRCRTRSPSSVATDDHLRDRPDQEGPRKPRLHRHRDGVDRPLPVTFSSTSPTVCTVTSTGHRAPREHRPVRRQGVAGRERALRRRPMPRLRSRSSGRSPGSSPRSTTCRPSTSPRPAARSRSSSASVATAA